MIIQCQLSSEVKWNWLTQVHVKIDDRIEMVVVTCDLLCARAVLSHFYSHCLYSAVRNLRLEKCFNVDFGTQLVLCDFKVVLSFLLLSLFL